MRREGTDWRSDGRRGLSLGVLALSLILFSVVRASADPLLKVRKHPYARGETELRWTGSQASWNHILAAPIADLRL
jgi:hypothetical protein